LDFDEMDFVVAGPGARDGIRKCFGSSSAGREREVIEYMALSQDEHFDRLGLRFGGLLRPTTSVAVPRLSQMTTTGQISGVTLLLVGSFARPHSGHMAVSARRRILCQAEVNVSSQYGRH